MVHSGLAKPPPRRPSAARRAKGHGGRGAASSRPHAASSSWLLEEALDPVRADLEAVTERILGELADPVARAVVYLVTAGGKRLRPALVLLSGAAGPAPDRKALIDTAAAVELIHTATLIHDDIIDQSPVRRAQPTFHARWGTERAVLMGDYLYATAFTVLARLRAPSVMQVMADVCRQLCRGELREVEARFRLDLSEEEYLQIIEDKTASLIAGCCRAGASLSGCEARVVEQFARFGLHVGLAFQIVDDCLDLSGDAARLGKSILADLDHGALSLPVIYLTGMLSGPERERLFAPLRAATPGLPSWAGEDHPRAIDPAILARVAEAARSRGAIAKAQARARDFTRMAHEALSGAPMNGLARAYELLTEYTVSRTT